MSAFLIQFSALASPASALGSSPGRDPDPGQSADFEAALAAEDAAADAGGPAPPLLADESSPSATEASPPSSLSSTLSPLVTPPSPAASAADLATPTDATPLIATPNPATTKSATPNPETTMAPPPLAATFSAAAASTDVAGQSLSALLARVVDAAPEKESATVVIGSSRSSADQAPESPLNPAADAPRNDNSAQILRKIASSPSSANALANTSLAASRAIIGASASMAAGSVSPDAHGATLPRPAPKPTNAAADSASPNSVPAAPPPTPNPILPDSQATAPIVAAPPAPTNDASALKSRSGSVVSSDAATAPQPRGEATTAQMPSASAAATLILDAIAAGPASPPVAVAPDQVRVKVSVLSQRAYLPPTASDAAPTPPRAAASSSADRAFEQTLARAMAAAAQSSQPKPSSAAIAPQEISPASPSSAVGVRAAAAANAPSKDSDAGAQAAPTPAAPTPQASTPNETLGEMATTLSPPSAPSIDGAGGPRAESAKTMSAPINGGASTPSFRRDLDVALEPADLGGLAVRLKSRGDRLEIAFVAQRDDTARLIDSGGARLATQLRDAGLGLGGLEVSVASGAGAALANPQSAFADGLSGGGGFSSSSAQGGASSDPGARQNSSNDSHREQANDAGEQTAAAGGQRSDRDLYL